MICSHENFIITIFKINRRFLRIFNRERRSNRGLKNDLVVVVLILSHFSNCNIATSPHTFAWQNSFTPLCVRKCRKDRIWQTALVATFLQHLGNALGPCWSLYPFEFFSIKSTRSWCNKIQQGTKMERIS